MRIKIMAYLGTLILVLPFFQLGFYLPEKYWWIIGVVAAIVAGMLHNKVYDWTDKNAPR